MLDYENEKEEDVPVGKVFIFKPFGTSSFSFSPTFPWISAGIFPNASARPPLQPPAEENTKDKTSAGCSCNGMWPRRRRENSEPRGEQRKAKHESILHDFYLESIRLLVCFLVRRGLWDFLTPTLREATV